MSKTIVLTGGTSGIGLATLDALNRQGHSVTLVVRDENKAKRVLQNREIENKIFVADLLDMDSVHKAAKEITASHPGIDVLINNAGGMFPDRELSREGVERSIAMNHLGHFALTLDLIDLIKDSSGRIINVSSGAHRMARLDVDDLAMERGFSSMRAYANAKLCNILFTISLNIRYRENGVKAFALHPGVVGTGFGRGLGKFGNAIYKLFAPFMLSPQSGAKTTLHLVSEGDLDPDEAFYFEKSKPANASLPANYEEMAGRLWKVSTELTTR